MSEKAQTLTTMFIVFLDALKVGLIPPETDKMRKLCTSNFRSLYNTN